MQRMGLAALLDKHIPTHGSRQGLSLGELSVVWLAHILSQADHRMNRVQEWRSRRLETLRRCGLESLSPQDLTDDRMADVLRLFTDDSTFQAFEQYLMGHLLCIYDLSASCVRIDTTTASSYADVNEHGLLQLGHSKDHRPDLPQLKLVLASLDLLGKPLATEVLSGDQADDPLYLSLFARVRSGLHQQGLMYVGDCKMAAVQTRASIAAHSDPLSALQAPSEQVCQDVANARLQGVHLIEVCRLDEAGKNCCIAQGYETSHSVTVQVEGERYLGRSVACWSNRKPRHRPLRHVCRNACRKPSRQWQPWSSGDKASLA